MAAISAGARCSHLPSAPKAQEVNWSYAYIRRKQETGKRPGPYQVRAFEQAYNNVNLVRESTGARGGLRLF
jgi:hypothetical protein